MARGGAIVIIDANVLYPVSLRSFLLHLADNKLLQPKWTRQINDEWKRNVCKKYKDLTEDRLQVTIDVMNVSFPDANVIEFESLIRTLVLPDKNDIHILAAAIKAKATVLRRVLMQLSLGRSGRGCYDATRSPIDQTLSERPS